MSNEFFDTLAVIAKISYPVTMLDIAGQTAERDNQSSVTDILIVGTGFSGLAMAIKLRKAGFDRFMLIEKTAESGGTWRDNTYPGCACDIPSHLYSLSFEPKSGWSRMYPRQPEIRAYLRGLTEKHQLHLFIRFNTTLMAAGWSEAENLWHVTTSSGPIIARVLISGVGGLHIPAIPELPGIENFQGRVFHSAAWDHSCDLTGKSIAVIGTGASAVQFVPQLAPLAARLSLFQRTPSWVIPKPDRPFSEMEKKLFAAMPLWRALFRRWLFWTHEIRVLNFLGNKAVMRLARHQALSHLNKQVSDPALRAMLTPDYQPGCKRLMISNDYFPALTRPNVELVTAGIAEIRPGAAVDTAGVERPIDVIIFGTGFEVTSAYRHINITGAGGKSLGALWDQTGLQAYLGIAVAGFPNYFMLLGPHTALGHNSVILMIEAQVNYIVDALKKMRRQRMPAMNVTQEAQNRFIAGLQTRLQGTVWQKGGCKSWYQDAQGRVTTIWPGSVLSYRRATKSADLRDYDLLATRSAKMTV